MPDCQSPTHMAVETHKCYMLIEKFQNLLVKAIVERHENLAKDSFAANALSGCNSMSCLHSIGKCMVINTSQSEHFHCTWRSEREISGVVAEARRFIAVWYVEGRS